MSNNKQLRKEIEKIHKLASEMSPERMAAIDEAFASAAGAPDSPEPPMRQMSLGGEYCFDQNRKQVELNGEFSKDDLLRIALILIDN